MTNYAERRAERYKTTRPPFGKVDMTDRSWDKYTEGAERECAVMVAEFHTWLVKTRIETEADFRNQSLAYF